MSVIEKPLSILIAGGGVAGPCLAYWLTRANLPTRPIITIVERAPAPRTQGQSIDIRDAAVGIIRKMNLEQTIKAKTTPEQGLVFIGSKGQAMATFGKSGDTEKQSMTSEFEILRADLASVFIDATKDRKGITYVFGQRVETIEQDDTGVDVTFTAGELKKERYDLVVAADGATSKTRQAIFGPDDPSQFRFLHAYYAFFSIPYDKELDEPPMWRWYNTVGGRALNTRPHNDPATTGVLMGINLPGKQRHEILEQALTQDVAAQKKAFQDIFRDAGWQADRICNALETADDFYMTRLEQVRIPKWSKGRCICIGDAGWAPTFMTGAGTSLGIEAGYLLAGELALADGDVPKALESFEHGFRPHVEKTQKFPDSLPQMANPYSKLALGIRKSILTVLGATHLFGAISRLFDAKTIPPREFDWKEE